MTQLKKNMIIELDIDAIGSAGEGIGRYNGMAVFVPATAVGDRVETRVVKVQKSLAFGRAERVISPSPDRTESGCAAYPTCGGCAYRHITYSAECMAKRQRVIDAMKRIGSINIEPERFLACDSPDRYRNKAQMPCELAKDGTVRFGYYARHSHRVVGGGDCLLQPESFTVIAEAISRFMERHTLLPYDEERHMGLVRNLYIRQSRSSGETVVCLVINGDSLPVESELAEVITAACPKVSGVIININKEQTNVVLGRQCRTIWGSDEITDSLLGVRFRISPLSFFQVNPAQTERLYAAAAQYADLTGSETVLDMYCGAGTIGLTMAGKAKRVIGVEVIPQAVEDAYANARLNGITNAEFICGDAAQAAEKLAADGITPDVVVLDPPRKGCDAALLRTVAGMSPARIVYVSCDPATLARDIRLLADIGYCVDRMTAVDMFPRTMHVETVVSLQRVI